MADLVFPFLDLFEMLQREGMKLSPEQYDLLRQALSQGLGLENWDGQNWDDLRQICRVLWVKPSRNYDAQVFEQVFDRYVRQKRREIQQAQKLVEEAPKPESRKSPDPTRQWPKVPPRKMPVNQPAPEEAKTPIAVKTGLAGLPEVDESGLSLTPSQFPLPQRAILDTWQLLRRPLRKGIRDELDLDATIRCITKQGYFSDVVMRPIKSKRAELIVFVDDSNVMLPFWPALQPLVNAIESQKITPATIYRFTTYPDEYLYAWKQPTQALPFDQILARMHPRRTIVLIWGDAGATQASPLDDHRQGLLQFLTRLSPCVRSLIWLNPLPPHRWVNTLASEVAYWLDGRMTYLSAPAVLSLAKLPASDDRLFLRAPV
ncbi:hypothetical protein NDI52_07190 [Leptolyngbya sp. PL-A3]|uniref:hypothetical protein n=1 Tax=Leptolyngbya sp. PL-A3 TaxID=2933911 RepID=UPI0032990995